MFQVSGVEKRQAQADHIWFSYANNAASAAHLEKLFQLAGYSRITTKDLEDA